MKFQRALVFSLAVAFLGASAAQATWWLSIHDYAYYVSQSLAHSNGQKIVTGVGNKLHMVFEDNGVIKYSQSSDGVTWFGPTVLACGSPGRLPAIAADSSGKLAVIWVDDPTTSLQYVFYNGSTWSMPMTLVADGDEPTIVARAGTVHLAWRPAAADSIEYAAFSLTAPSLITTSETVDQAACASEDYRLPSIALSLDPCKPPIPVIAYLYDAVSPCVVGSTIGPRVCKRDNTLGTWSMTWQDPLTHMTSTSVQPISISLSSRFSARELYVAYSDVQNGVARTKLGHGIGTTWTWSVPATIDALARHIHVRANESGSSPVGTFRLVRESVGSYYSEYRDGLWPSPNLVPTWSTAWAGTTGPPATRPHAHWWKRCSAGTQTDLRLIAEEDLSLCIPCPPAMIGAELEQVSPCPTSGPIVLSQYPCKHIAVAVATHFSPAGGPGVTLVDATRAGVITTFTEQGAVLTTDTGGRIDITWGAGKVLESSESTLTITAPASSVRFSSSTVRFSVEDLGTLSGYDRAPGGEVCPLR